ncbi:lipoprotein insertase outer membrane protein LolB [Hahella sp. SMD15-11]|uniref:Outer-membrane lipoprotein LolB n=1 Tax=Thermohahella caldifontis TaxID=3142973 RepID=A0AB39UVZ4_9GAMM
MRLRSILPVLLVVFLAGCATTPPAPPVPPDQAAAAALSRWQVTGKIGVTQGKTRHFAAINSWVQSGDHFDIRLSSTLFGLGAARLTGTPGHIRIIQGDDVYLSDAPDKLVREALKLPLPVSALPWWARGLPLPGQPWTQAPESAPGTRQFNQLGWEVVASRFTPVNGITLPTRVDLSRDNLRIRLVITTWQLN